MREAVHADISPARRRLLHTEAARLLHERGANPEDVASHLLAGERPAAGWTVAALRAAAAVDLARGAPRRAAELLAAALESPAAAADRAELLVELGYRRGPTTNLRDP